MIVEYRMLVTESPGHNRAALVAALKEHNVKTAIVTYSGAGDSGDVDGVETIPQEAIKALAASKVTMRLPKGEFIDGQYVYRKEDVEQPIIDTLRAFTFNWWRSATAAGRSTTAVLAKLVIFEHQYTLLSCLDSLMPM